MSAYGAIKLPARKAEISLKPRFYRTAQNDTAVVVFPLRRDDVVQELSSYLAAVFNQVVEEGKTYPQEDQLSQESFDAYFLSK